MTTMRHDVFLSHSHVDKVYADAVCHKLEASGIRCWVAPRDIRPSEDWAEAIINAMDNCRILLLIFSSSSNSSPQVRREVERAAVEKPGILHQYPALARCHLRRCGTSSGPAPRLRQHAAGRD